MFNNIWLSVVREREGGRERQRETELERDRVKFEGGGLKVAELNQI